MGRKLLGFDASKEWDYENGFYLTSHVTRVAKALAQFEPYKLVLCVPGHVVECGVFKGASFIRLATFREVLESPYSRRLVGFDAFGRFPRRGAVSPEEKRFVDDFELAAGRSIKVSELREVMKRKGIANYELVRADVVRRAPAYLAANPAFRIALLHILTWIQVLRRLPSCRRATGGSCRAV